MKTREELGLSGMLKCLGNSSSLADEFISALTALKSPESVGAWFGDRKSEK